MSKTFSEILREVTNAKKKKVEDTIPTVSTGVADPASPMHIMNPTNTSMSVNGGDQNITPFSERRKKQLYRIDEWKEYVKRQKRDPNKSAFKYKPAAKPKVAKPVKPDIHKKDAQSAGDAHIVTQLRSATDAPHNNPATIRFTNGEVVRMHPNVANHVLNHHMSIPKPNDKLANSSKMGASKVAMANHIKSLLKVEDIQGYDNAAIFNPPKMWDTTVKSSALAMENVDEGKKQIGKDKLRVFLQNMGSPKALAAVKTHYGISSTKTKSKSESMGPPYSQALSGPMIDPYDPTRQPTSHAIPTASMDIESANGKKNKDVADRLKQMIMQMLNKEEIIDPNERKRIADMKSRQLKMADDKHSDDKAKTRAQINDAHKRRMGMESFNDVFGRFISEAGFPARGKQDSDVEGDRQGVSKDPPASMNSKKEKIIPLEKDNNAKKKLPSKKADVIVINPKLNVEAADDEIVKTRMPKHDKKFNWQRHNALFPGVTNLSKILKDNIVAIPKPKTLSHIIKEKSETGNLADWAKKHEASGNKITKDNKTATYHAFDKNNKHLDSYRAGKGTRIDERVSLRFSAFLAETELYEDLEQLIEAKDNRDKPGGASNNTKGIMHEILVGKHLNNNKHMTHHLLVNNKTGAKETPEQAHDRLKSQVHPDDYKKINARAKSTAEHIKAHIEKTHPGHSITGVAHTSKRGDTQAETGVKADQKEDPSDIYIATKHHKTGDVMKHGVSLKVSDQSNKNVPSSSLGRKSAGETADRLYKDHQNEIKKTHQGLVGKSKDARKNWAKANPEKHKQIKAKNLDFLRSVAHHHAAELQHHLDSGNHEHVVDHIRDVIAAKKTPAEQSGKATFIKHTTYTTAKGSQHHVSHPGKDYEHILKAHKNITVKPAGTQVHFYHNGKKFASQAHKLDSQSDPLSSLKSAGKTT